ncbi:MAG: Type 1 glutamine amidotransferase-like domain-containing protein [Caldilineaceae bacterium]|nr:Type 1 glutamine amidotransferase-like domain-containing protein [Caldilineaceae bacterium]
MQLHLFSSPGEGDIRYILDACRPYLVAAANPVVAYLPAASWRSNWLAYTENAFAGLGEIAYLDTETMTLEAMQAMLDRAACLYVSGGNTYLLNYRLHQTGLLEVIRRRVLDALPFIGFSAGAILCGPNILTTNDMNLCATTHFAGLNLAPYNFDAHFPTDEGAREQQADWLLDYHAYHDNPILALQDGAYLSVDQGRVEVRQGVCWLIEKGQAHRQVAVGTIL